MRRAALLAALVPALAVALAASLGGCRDGDSEGDVVVARAGLSEATPSVTAPITSLTYPQTIVASNANLNNVTCVLPVHHYSSFDIGQKPSEFVEGGIYVGLELPNAVSGTVRLVQAIANTAASGLGATSPYWPPSGTSILPVRGLAIDILEYDPGTRINFYTPEELLLKGRLWVATGRFDAGLGRGVSRLHVLAGRGDSGRSPVELTSLTPTAIDDAGGEHLTALTSAPPGIILFAASQTRLLRITPAKDESQSVIETFADLPRGAADETIASLACDTTSRLYVLRRGPASFSISVFDAATIAAIPASATALALTSPPGAPVLVSPTAISVNSADHLVVAERASGLFFEYDGTGALVATLTARSASLQLPDPPASTANTANTFTVTGANQISAFACDPYLSRIVFATDAVPQGAGGANPGLRTLANVTLRGGIAPILENRCVFCHNDNALLGGLDLTGPADVVRARLLQRACESYAENDPARPAECFVLPVQNPFFRNDIPVSPTTGAGVFNLPGETCPNCPIPETARIEPGIPTASYVVRKLLVRYDTSGAPNTFSINYFPADLSLPIFTNNCASNDNATLEAGEACGERCPQGSFVQRPLRRAEIDMIEEWIRRGAQDD